MNMWKLRFRWITMHAQFGSRTYSLTYYLFKIYLLTHSCFLRYTIHEDGIIMSLRCGDFWHSWQIIIFAVKNRPLIFNNSVGVEKRVFWIFFGYNKMQWWGVFQEKEFRIQIFILKILYINKLWIPILLQTTNHINIAIYWHFTFEEELRV